MTTALKALLPSLFLFIFFYILFFFYILLLFYILYFYSYLSLNHYSRSKIVPAFLSKIPSFYTNGDSFHTIYMDVTTNPSITLNCKHTLVCGMKYYALA